MRALLVLALLFLASCGGSGDSDTTQNIPAETEADLPSRTVEIATLVYDTPEAAQPLAVGSRVPAVEVHRLNGEPVNLAAEVNDGATLIFYRGGW